jgi:hypothetical protein|tara:strand:- start:649 stop:1065 length:417 start_codon:yes stop_codon:yes gene_type:complete
MSIELEIEKIIQIKLSTGQEIIAQSIEVDTEDSFVISHSLEMVAVEYDDDEIQLNKSYYILRPFVSYPEALDVVVSINPNAIVCINKPSKKVIEQYASSCDAIQEMLVDDNPVDDGTDSDPTPRGNILSFPPKLLTED